MRNRLGRRREPRRGVVRHRIEEIGIIGARGVQREAQCERKLQLVALLRLLRPALPGGGAGDPRRRHLRELAPLVVEVSEGVDVADRRRGERRSIKVAAAGERALAVAAPAGLALQAYRGVDVSDPVGGPVISDEVPFEGGTVGLSGTAGLAVAGG